MTPARCSRPEGGETSADPTTRGGFRCPPTVLLIAVLALLLVIDLAIMRGRTMSLRGAAIASAVWVGVALAFFAVLLAFGDGGDAQSFLAGYLVEKSLSLDNVFVFLLVFSAFAVSEADRHRLLTYGIVIALVLRAVFIVVGAAALSAFGWLSFVFAAFLIWTGWKLFRHRHDHDAETALVEKVRHRIPFSPAWAALAGIAVVDILFPVDSVPAILAITNDTFIVFAANAFALLGLRPLFFLVADLVDRLYYLKTALAALLIFIGAKLAAAEFVGKIGPEISLPAIAAILGDGRDRLAVRAGSGRVKAADRESNRRTPRGRCRSPRPRLGRVQASFAPGRLVWMGCDAQDRPPVGGRAGVRGLGASPRPRSAPVRREGDRRRWRRTTSSASSPSATARAAARFDRLRRAERAEDDRRQGLRRHVRVDRRLPGHAAGRALRRRRLRRDRHRLQVDAAAGATTRRPRPSPCRRAHAPQSHCRRRRRRRVRCGSRSGASPPGWRRAGRAELRVIDGTGGAAWPRRRRPESNRCKRLCRPLRATPPRRRKALQASARSRRPSPAPSAGR